MWIIEYLDILAGVMRSFKNIKSTLGISIDISLDTSNIRSQSWPVSYIVEVLVHLSRE